MQRLKALVRSLARSYRLHHESNPSLLHWLGFIGFIALSVFFLARLTGKLPPRWNDVYFRVPGIVFCLLLILRRWWPGPVRRYYLPYSYFTAFYCLAFFLPLTLLENGGAPNTVANMMLGAGLVILMTDWRNTLVMVIGGYLASAAWFLATHPAAEFPMEFLYWWVPLCMVLVAGGSVSKYVERRSELERLRRLYTGLAGSIAHEVRNPMAQVQHALERAQAILPRSGTSEVVAVQRQQLAALSRSLSQGAHAVRRGLQAVTLTLQQVNGRPLDRSTFTRLSAAVCVRKAVDEYAYENAKQRAAVTLDVQEDFDFDGDETACVLVLFNLLKNALYYLPLHPEATITVSVHGGPAHHIVVRDTGPGIAPDRVGDLFEEFHSFDKAEGSGLGLAFCRRVMQAFGGAIGCHSLQGSFTAFTLSFPQVSGDAPGASEAQAADAPLVPAAGFIGRTVLVVDDSAFNRKIVKARLREMGLRVLEAGHGEEALRLIDEGARPEAILMDMQMPGLSGLETTRALRERPAPVNAIPVLALSANDLPSWREGALAVGIDGYLTKPLQPELLHAELGRILQVPPSSPTPPDSGPPLADGRQTSSHSLRM
jgi:signal transduction histidine kinase/ActR/RegA family two-component response regulator